MTSPVMRTEERLRAATRAAAGTVPVGSAPPLRLPDLDEPVRAARRRRRWGQWLAPAGAALAVTAVVVAALIFSHAEPSDVGRQGPAGGALPGGIPRYYGALVQEPGGPWWAQIRDTATGSVVATVSPPRPFTRFSAITAAADDRTFVLAAIGPQGQPSVTRFYVLRLDPARQTGQLSPLPIPEEPERWGVYTLALSPDGRRLAVALEPPGAQRPRLQVFSLASGSVREWGINARHAPVIGWMSWTADGRTLEWGYPLDGNAAALLDMSRPGTSLLHNSRLVRFPAGIALTGGQVMTSGGQQMASAAYFIASRPGAVPSGWMIAGFSARTGKPSHIFYRRQFRAGRQEEGPGAVWWASPSGRVLIASPAAQGPGAARGYAGVGVFRGHRYTPLPWSRQIREAAW